MPAADPNGLPLSHHYMQQLESAARVRNRMLDTGRDAEHCDLLSIEMDSSDGSRAELLSHDSFRKRESNPQMRIRLTAAG